MIAGTDTASRCRHRFPIFERLVYANSCSQGALSDTVLESHHQFLRDWDEHGSPWGIWGQKVEEARHRFANLINADPACVAVVSSVSLAVSSLASGLEFTHRPKVVVSDFEFPTVGQVWHAQEARGAVVSHVRADGNRIPVELFSDAIDQTTLLVSITAVCYRNGARLEVDEIVPLAHESGAHVLFDAYQAIGTYPIDVEALDVDFLVAGSLKYLLGSSGLGFLYCRKPLIETIRPTVTGWLADSDIGAMSPERYSPSPTASRFEGGAPAIPSVYASIAGMEVVEEIGVDETRAHVSALTEVLIDGVDDLGGDVATPRDPSMRGALVCINSTDAQQLVSLLADEGVVTSTRDGHVRVSLHAYNTREDIEAILGALRQHRSLL